VTLGALIDWASDKTRFNRLSDFIEFAEWFLDFKATGLQAIIVSQNEQNYRFYQYGDDGHFNITRPINSNLTYERDTADQKHSDFLESLRSIRDLGEGVDARRRNLIEVVYTVQQSIGATLDALPAGQSNRARKLNGDLFERLIQLVIQEIGVSCASGTVQVPVPVDGQVAFNMSYQHDLLIRQADELKVIGSVKTSSKDRIDKIFLDKFLYCKLTGTALPHIAIFLNDVQRKNTRRQDEYGVSATFLPGHFKGFTVNLNPLDGVYYCDLRPNMRTDPMLAASIKTIDHLLCDDIWNLLAG
jgi:hypothetical protein